MVKNQTNLECLYSIIVIIIVQNFQISLGLSFIIGAINQINLFIKL